MNWKRMRSILLESAGILTVAPVISMFAGLTLNSEFGAFVRLPLLLALAPLLNGLAGDFGTIITSTITTSLHLGTIRPRIEKNPILARYLAADFCSTILASIYMYLVLYLLSPVLGLGTVNPLSFFLLITLSGVIIISIIAVSGILVAFISYSRGLNPANVAFPVVTSIGDLSGAISLIMVARYLGLL